MISGVPRIIKNQTVETGPRKGDEDQRLKLKIFHIRGDLARARSSCQSSAVAMAVLNTSMAYCVAVRSSAAAPSSSESNSAQPPGRPSPSSSSSSFDPKQTKVILPKKKPLKWSTGVAPGEYGGPPTTTKLRKYWGGGGQEDPVTATDDFIWNKDFVDRMKRLIREEDGSGANASVGFLPLSPSQVTHIIRPLIVYSFS